jgi:mannitol-1-phosphate 5-dehydrogenase
MPLTGSRTYVGFGFGAIQGGLFLYEAFRSGNFRRLVVGEVLPGSVRAVRAADGRYSVNIAHLDHIEIAEVAPLEIEDPASSADRERLVKAVAEAEEIATAVPSVQHYTIAGPGSLHCILAEGLRKKAARHGARAVIYAAENHNRAAEILEASVLSAIPREEWEPVRGCVRFVNTVIGKMSGMVKGAEELKRQQLAPITPLMDQAFLVEAFNRILVSRVHFPETSDGPFRRGIKVFEEKEDLLPFEEAKLYGHNATHALAAYVGSFRGARRIADLQRFPDILRFLRAAFVEESGAALIRKHSGTDPLFTRKGYCEYAEDLLARMVNPFLQDTVERVGRDPKRKLEWDDRLTGTMVLALREGVTPHRYAMGAASALAVLDPSVLEQDVPVAAWLDPIWSSASPETGEKDALLELIEAGRHRLKDWRRNGFQNLEELF